MPERSCRWIAIALLAFMALLAGASALKESAAVDEIAHIGAGLSYVQKLDLRMNQEHPPLAKLLSGVFLAIGGKHADYASQLWRESETLMPAYLLQWAFGDSVYGKWNDWHSTLLWARLPMLLLTLLLGWLVYSYARRLTDPAGGLLCLAVFCATPTFLVFGPLVLTDIPVTLFTLMALWQIGSLWREPTPRNRRFLSLALAGALLTKFTGLLLFPVILVLFAYTRFKPSASEPADKLARKQWRRLRWRAMWKSSAWSFLIVYATYLLLSINMPDTALEKLGSNNGGFLIHASRRLLMPIWLYIRGVILMLALGSRPTYLFGQHFPHGEPFYFPVLFVLKSPLGLLLLLALAAGVWFWTKNRRSTPLINEGERAHWLVAMTGFFVFLAVCLLSRLDISIRHFTVPMVLLILMLAPLPRLLSGLPRKAVWNGVMLLLVAQCFVSVLMAYPHLLPYVNALAGQKPPYLLLNDSNVDWGQALPETEAFANEKKISHLQVDEILLSDPASTVPRAQIWDCQAPTATDAGQWVVVSAVNIRENRNCSWLERYPQQSLAAGGMYAFHLPDVIPPPGAPGGPPLPKDRMLFFGAPFDLRGFVVNLERHPESVAQTMKEMTEKFKKH